MNSDIKKSGVHPLRSILSNWGGFLFSAVVGFFLSPYIVGKLGATSYGIWALIGSLVGYLGFLDLGVRSAVTKFIASYHSAGDHDRASDMKSAAMLVFTSAGFLAIVVALAINPFVEQIFSIPPGSVGVARITLMILATNVAVALIAGVYGGILTARHRFDLSNAISVCGIIFRSTAIVVFLESEQAAQHSDQRIAVLAAIQLLSSIVELILIRAASRHAYREASFGLRRAFARENLRKILFFGLHSSAIQVLAAIAHKSSLMIIGALMPVAMVTYYSIAETLSEYARQLLSGISYTIVPMVSSMEGEGQLHNVRRVLVDGTRYSSLVVLPVAVTLMLRGESFISLWMGVEYGQLSGQILSLLSVALWAMVGYQICTTTMIGLGKHKGMVPIFAFEAVVSISLSVALIQPLGVIGCAWGVLIARLFVAFVFSVVIAKKILRISVTEYYLHSVLRPLVAILPFALVTYGIESSWRAGNLAVFFLQVVLAIPIAIVGSWLLGLRAAERTAVTSAIKRRVGR